MTKKMNTMMNLMKKEKILLNKINYLRVKERKVMKKNMEKKKNMEMRILMMMKRKKVVKMEN